MALCRSGLTPAAAWPLKCCRPRPASSSQPADSPVYVCAEEHLQHWGINMMTAEKTQATMTELQIKLNMSYEFDQITESGQSLQPMAGPGCAPPEQRCTQFVVSAGTHIRRAADKQRQQQGLPGMQSSCQAGAQDPAAWPGGDLQVQGPPTPPA